VSIERLVDDLARTLAEPMPRRRVLRVLGMSLAAATVPALGPRSARAVTGAAKGCNTSVETCCEPDHRVCHKDAPVPINKGYCCRAPAWRFGCGTKANGYKCIDSCRETALQFSCTSKKDKYGWTNGTCCPRAAYVGCNADGSCKACASDEQICSPYKQGQSRCCDPARGERCFANLTSTACCGKDQLPVIKPGKPVQCACKPRKGTVCGADCCAPERCCGGKECCEPGETCCSGRCCKPGRACCDVGCCADGEWCLHKQTGRLFSVPVCMPTCTPGNRCGNGQCCGSGFSCVGGACVP
jgi:hypothetical protein